MKLLRSVTFITGILSAVIFYITMKKNKENVRRAKSKILLGIAVICLICRVLLTDIEYYINFDSPEKAYRFVYLEKNPTVLVGEESACATGADGYLTLVKEENGWRIPDQSVTTVVCMKTVEGTTVFVNRYKDTNDYYVSVSNFSGISSGIHDNLNSKFYKRNEDSLGVDGDLDIYDAYINEFNNQYVVTVNGVKIVLL